MTRKGRPPVEGTEDQRQQQSRYSAIRSGAGRPILRFLAEVSRVWSAALSRRSLWAVLLLVVGTWVLQPDNFLTRQEEVGSIARRNYVAERDFLLLDEESTAEKRKRAEETVLPIYDFDSGEVGELDAALAALFAAGREQVTAKVVEGLAENVSKRVLPDAAAIKLLRAHKFSSAVEDRFRSLYSTVLDRGVVAGKPLLLENRDRGVTLRNVLTGGDRIEVDLFGFLGYPDEVGQFLTEETARWPGWSRAERRTVTAWMLGVIQPNVSYNLSETRTRRAEAANAVEPVFARVRRGQVVVRRGDELDENDVRIVGEMLRGVSAGSRWWPMLGGAVMMALIALALHQGLSRPPLGRRDDPKSFGGVVVIFLIGLVTLQAGFVICSAMAERFAGSPLPLERAFILALPYAALPLIVSLFYGRGAALLAAVVFSVLVGRGWVVGQEWEGSVYVIGTSVAAIYALDRLTRRVAVTRAGLLAGGVGVAMVFMLAAFRGELPNGWSLLSEAGFAFLGGLVVAASTSFAAPILETVLGKATDIKLIELSDTNLPLLRRLAFEAPGSFQHSLMVANLTKVACEEIGANSILAFTAGLYHDVGKVIRPAYFIENQQGSNPHDKLAPSISALILIKHVEEGVRLGQEAGLPREILDGIEQHHGTRDLSFFLDRAIEQAGDARLVEASKYRYPGPSPRSRVNGVLMLADAVEAASRSLREPSGASLQAVIDRIVADCMQAGQLDDTELTLSDLRQISKAFLRVLQTIHHRRIEYPGFVFEPSNPRGLKLVKER